MIDDPCLTWTDPVSEIGELRRRVAELEAAAIRPEHGPVGPSLALHGACLVSCLCDPAFAVDPLGRVMAWNRPMERLTGAPARDMIGKGDYAHAVPFYGHPRPTLIDLVLCPDPLWEKEYRDLSREEGRITAETYAPCLRDGEGAHLLVSASLLMDHDRAVIGAIESVRDVTRIKKLEEDFYRLALRDPLTRLPNRALFMDRLGQTLRRGVRCPETLFAVLFMDLDRFKIVNDSLGHMAGDQLLRKVGERIATCLRTSDTLARFGGDEFVALLEDLRDFEDVRTIVGRIRKELARPFRLEGQRVHASASIGVVQARAGDYAGPEEVLRDADAAMYHSKSQGASGYKVFHPCLREKAAWVLDMSTNLKLALECSEFEVHYLPVVDLVRRARVGFEALARWRNRERGLIAPAEFLPAAEESGLIHRLGAFVLATACRDVRDINARRPRSDEPFFVSVNISAAEFHSDGFVATVLRAVDKAGLDPRRLRLDLTEAALADDPVEAARRLEELRLAGIRAALDDFGMGFTTIEALRRFPFASVKVDRSITKIMNLDSQGRAMMDTIVALCAKMDVEVVAKGVESLQQVFHLMALSCPLAQGYYFSPPVDAEGLGRLLSGED